MSASAYLERIAAMVESLRHEQLGRIQEAAGIVADALRRDAIVHLFGDRALPRARRRRRCTGRAGWPRSTRSSTRA